MTTTDNNAVKALSLCKPNYDKVAEMPPAILTELGELVECSDSSMAAKAVYAASHINSKDSFEICKLAAVSRDPVVRATVASVLPRIHDRQKHEGGPKVAHHGAIISSKEFTGLLSSLLDDADDMVQAEALKSVRTIGTNGIKSKIRKLARERSDEPIGQLAYSLFADDDSIKIPRSKNKAESFIQESTVDAAVAAPSVATALGQVAVLWGPPTISPHTEIGGKEISFVSKGSYLSALLSGFEVAFEGQNDVLCNAYSVSFRVPVYVSENVEFLGFKSDIRGVVQKDEGCRVVLIADISGTTQVFQYTYGRQIDESFSHRMFSVASEPPVGTDYTITRKLALTVNLIILIERMAVQNHVSLKFQGGETVDSIDFEAVVGSTRQPIL